MKKWILLLLLCLPMLSQAQTTQVNATWTKPTQRTDASALDAADIKLYKIRIYIGQCAQRSCDGSNTVAFEGWFPGSYEQVYLRALDNYVTDWMTVEVVVIDTLDQESTPVSAQFDITAVADNGIADPNPITSLLIEIET